MSQNTTLFISLIKKKAFNDTLSSLSKQNKDAAIRGEHEERHENISRQISYVMLKSVRIDGLEVDFHRTTQTLPPFLL